MPKKPKTSKIRRSVTFPAFKIFSTKDNLSIDLLRLMSVCNDMSFIASWLNAHFHIPKDPLALEVDKSRISTLHRLWMAMLHEAFGILENMEALPSFPAFVQQLDAKGKQALQTLRETKLDKKVRFLLKNLRNRATFHYDRSFFQKAMKDLMRKFGDDLEGSFVVESKQTEQSKIYYTFANHLRNAISFGIRPRPELQKDMDVILRWHQAFFVFLDSAFIAYVNSRGLRGYISLK